jgi:adenylate kinase
MQKFIIMGAQGCGKGTQSRLLSAQLDLAHICVGDILRWNIQSRTKLAARIRRVVDAGELVPDEIVEQIVQERLEQHDWNFGFILDGFPRNTEQAEFFLESYDVDAVIHIQVTDELVIERVLSRRICPECILDYSLIHHRPEVENTCDVCGTELIVRADDDEETVRTRLSEYRLRTEPILGLFERKELVFTVDGSKSIQDVFTDILEAAESAGSQV